MVESASKDELPPHPEGPLGTFVVTVPMGTIAIEAHAFFDCSSLTEITLPATFVEIGRCSVCTTSRGFRDNRFKF